MFDPFVQALEAVFVFVGTQLLLVFTYPIVPTQRIFWLYLLSSGVLALLIFYLGTRAAPNRLSSPLAFLRFLFPKEVWRTRSAWLDVRYFFFHQITRAFLFGAFLTGVLHFVFQMVAGSPLTARQLEMGAGLSDIALSTAYMLVLFVVVDFVNFGLHYLQHKVPLLWEFHKVHHSLEVMHPLSNYREHPIDNIFYAVVTGAAYGLIMGAANNLFGYVPGLPEILGIPLLAFAFNLLGYNLRHSHIWLRWPGSLSMLFASPAHHHVHHSCHPDHIDKNFAFIFPFWDVLCGTYLVPQTNKDVRFGISPDYVNEYKSCLGLYCIPFMNAWRLVSKKSDELAARRRAP